MYLWWVIYICVRHWVRQNLKKMKNQKPVKISKNLIFSSNDVHCAVSE